MSKKEKRSSANDGTRKVNWAKWSLIPSAELWQLVALSLGIEPSEVRFSRDAWMSGSAGLLFDEDRTFCDRIEVARARTSELRNTLLDVGNPDKSAYTLRSFAVLAASCAWSLPEEFPRGEDIAALPGGRSSGKPQSTPVTDYQCGKILVEIQTIAERKASKDHDPSGAYANMALFIRSRLERDPLARAEVLEIASGAADRIGESLATRERKSLHQIIVALCKEHKYDLSRATKTAGVIAQIAQRHALSIRQRTIEEHLRKAQKSCE